MSARKTIAVSELVDRLNQMLATDVRLRGVEPDGSDNPTPEMAYRIGVAAALEQVLFRTNNYRGFAFTDGAQGESDPTRRRYTSPDRDRPLLVFKSKADEGCTWGCTPGNGHPQCPIHRHDAG